MDAAARIGRGWVESVALVHHAFRWAGQVTRVSGPAVEGIDLGGLESVSLVAGMADAWWRGPGSLVAVNRGEADCFGNPKFLRTLR